MSTGHPEYPCNGKKFPVTKEVKDAYTDKGYVILRNLFSVEEVEHIKRFLEEKKFSDRKLLLDDGEGEQVGIVMWNHPGDDLTGWVARCNRMIDTAEGLLGGEAYHYHTKIILKEAKSAGKWHWHQDYGYWYENGCMFPDMTTVFMALDKADRDNGCLQILSGSHKMGRLTHFPAPNQVSVDPERLEWAKQLFPRVHLEVEPGDAVFFHCNLLHTSGHNRSDRKRHGFLVAYNKNTNNPMFPGYHPQVTPLHKVSDSMIMEGEWGDVDWEGKDFFVPGFKHIARESLLNKETTSN